tara:strand:- start:223 stop:702 length:480 start_codon:yes stop_codon:yes gene_type:complete
MLIDSTLSFGTQNGASDAIGATSAEKVLTHIDLRPVGITDNATVDFGAGEPLYFVIQCNTALTDANAAPVVTFFLVTDSATNMTTAPQVLLSTDGMAEATLAAGARFVFALPSTAVSDYKRYLGVKCKVSTGDGLDGGIVEAFITKDVSNWTSTDTRTD